MPYIIDSTKKNWLSMAPYVGSIKDMPWGIKDPTISIYLYISISPDMNI